MESTSQKELEKELIRSMVGEYSVSFKFAETFSDVPDYEYAERMFEHAHEYVFVLYENENEIALQHLLFTSKSPLLLDDHQLIKHWRQNWVYENQEFWTLEKGHHWVKSQKSKEEVKGTWTQKVYQVDDSPRYEGMGTWVHVDGRHFWQGSADAPLARRDSIKRKDYNVLRRNSHIEIFKDGSWVIDQDNEKIMRDENGNDSLICHEKGMERFTRTDFDTAPVLAWWEKRKPYWEDVRLFWDKLMEEKSSITLEKHMQLYAGQFRQAEKFLSIDGSYDQEGAKTAIESLIREHLVEK